MRLNTTSYSVAMSLCILLCVILLMLTRFTKSLSEIWPLSGFTSIFVLPPSSSKQGYMVPPLQSAQW